MTVAYGWYRRKGKRGLDLLTTLLTAPATTLVGAFGSITARISIRDHGMFSQQRVGREGQIFTIWKLRTMRPVTADELSAHDVGVTAGGNARITPAGAWLRRTKLDELPQLYNVLKGDMSLVGPRPDVPEWLDVWRQYPDALSVRPGLTSLASLAYVDEEDVLAAESHPVQAYAERILPHKLRLNELYARNVSLKLDLKILALTALSVVSRDRAQRSARRIIVALGGDPDPAG